MTSAPPIRIVNQIKVEAFQTLGFSGLDPITFVLRDCGEGRGKIIIECYGKAWSAYWGAMGKETLRQFIITCDAEYIANCMTANQRRTSKAENDYLLRIVKAVKQALSMQPHFVEDAA